MSNTNLVRNGDFMEKSLGPNVYVYAVNAPNENLFPNWYFSDSKSSYPVLQNGNGGFTPGLQSNEQCLVIQQGSNASINVNQDVTLKYPGNYVLTFKNRHRNQDGWGDEYYDKKQQMSVKMFMNESSPVIPEQDCTPQFTGNVSDWKTKTYNFNIPSAGTYTLRFRVTMPFTTKPGTSLFLRNVNIQYLQPPKPTVAIKSCDTFVDGYTKNLISSTTQQNIVENEKNSYTSVFSDTLTNTINNPVSDYFNFNLRMK